MMILLKRWMTSSINKKSYLIVIGLLFFSCGESERQAKQNRKNIEKVELGFTEAKAIEIMGKPEFSKEYFNKIELDTQRTYIYNDVFLSDEGISFTVNSDSIVIDIHY